MEFLYYIFVLFSVMVMIKSDSKIRAEKKDGGVLITCDSEEEEYTYWEWKPINESQFIELPIYVNRNAFFKGYSSKALTIRYSSKDVYGNYRCRYYTNSRHRQRKRSSELVVGYPEKPAVKERKYFVKENMSITMKCFPKQSFPEGRIWWSKWPKRSDHTNCNEHNISDTDNYSGIYTSSLTIKNFDTKDVGDYVCCVKNEYGNSSSDRIKVMKGERPRVTSKQQTVYAEIGRRIMLHVNIHKGNPEANVTWYNHGAPFLKSGTERYSGYNISHPGLWIYNVTQNDSGTYRCSAVNIFNSSSVEIRLIAGNIPIVDSNSLEIVSFSGKELIIHCKHDIKSEPTKVEWIYNDNFAILVSQSKRHSGGNLSIPSLTIHASKKSDSGKYVCCITNDFGVGCSSVIEVTITDVVRSAGYSQKKIIVGAVAAVVIVLICVLIVSIVSLKRKRGFVERSTRSSASEFVEQAKTSVIFRPEANNQDNTYLKLERVTGMTSTVNNYEELHARKNDTGGCNPDKVYCDIAPDDSPCYENRRVTRLIKSGIKD